MLVIGQKATTFCNLHFVFHSGDEPSEMKMKCYFQENFHLYNVHSYTPSILLECNKQYKRRYSSVFYNSFKKTEVNLPFCK